MATGKKLARPRTRASGPKAVGRPARARRVPSAPPAADMAQDGAGDVAARLTSLGPDPAPDAIIRLGTQLTIREAVALRVELLERVAAVDAVGLDASRVQKVDTAGLQVLVAFVQQRRRSGGSLCWTGASEPVRKAAGLLALDGALGLPAQGGTP